MYQFKDREPTYAHRMRITPEDGSAAFYATVERADEPTQEGTPLNAETFHAMQQAVGVMVYTHSRSTAGVHNFDGHGPNGRALLTAGFSSGDSFAVNGVKVNAAWCGSDAADDAVIVAGRWVSFTYDESTNTLNFKAGGGLNAADKKTVQDWMLSGHSVCSGKVAGGFPVYASQNYEVLTVDDITVGNNVAFKLPRAAYTYNGQIYVRTPREVMAEKIGLTADKLVSGQTVLGVSGKAVPMVMASFEINYAGGSTNPAATGCAAYGATKSGTGYVTLPAGTYRVVGHASYDSTEGIGLWVAKQGALGTALKSGTKLDYVQECAIDATLTLSAAATVTVVAHSDTAGHGRRGAVTITKTA